MPSIRPGRGIGVLEIPFSWFDFTLVGLEVNSDLEFVDDFSSHEVVRESWMLASLKGSGSFLLGRLLQRYLSCLCGCRVVGHGPWTVGGVQLFFCGCGLLSGLASWLSLALTLTSALRGTGASLL